jgi:DNA mismatch repair protein MutS2
VADLVALEGRTRNVATLRRSKEERLEAAEKSRPSAFLAGGNQIDLRGQRSEDALRDLRTSLDSLFQQDVREVTVVHGHGSGALKKAIREELESSPYAFSFRPGEMHEGGDGVTVITLKER